VIAASRLLGPVFENLLVLPRGLLRKSILATPYRFGFTAGALMGGLALMVAVWTQGGSAVRDWITKVKFPDGFAMGLNMPAEAERALREVAFVTDACAISMHPVETDAFGISGLTKVKTFFFAFDPEPFFRMSSIDWVQGDPATAITKLRSGGCVIVAREFLTARGMGVGGTFTCRGDDGKDQSFEIVGVVNSPGLEMADAFFDVGEEVHEQRVHAVFGSRDDLRIRFGVDHITLLQFSLRPDSNDAEALPAVREALMPFGVLNVGSGRQIRETITGFMRTGFTIVSWIAVFAMLTASFGVANLVVAGVQARRFEFGVMRAVGAMPGMLTRLVLGETLLVAAAAGFLGVCMGLQGAFGGSRLDAVVWGISLRVKPPWMMMLVGVGVLTTICLAAAWPAASSLRKAQPRLLLASMRG
jgi:putative ABC transport system permease protein